MNYSHKIFYTVTCVVCIAHMQFFVVFVYYVSIQSKRNKKVPPNIEVFHFSLVIRHILYLIVQFSMFIHN